jgi:pyruvate kinase
LRGSMGGLFVKIVASLGPSSTDEELVLRMAEAGADGFRTNFAHGDPEVWARRIRAVRAAEEKLGRPLAMIGDLKGPSVRVGPMPEPLQLRRGDRVLVAPAPGGQPATVPVPYPSLFEAAEPGDEILIDDGRVRLLVVDRRGKALECVSQVDGSVEAGKNVAIRGKDLDAPLIDERDDMALKFAASEGFDFVGLSYVRDAGDVEEVKERLKRLGSDAWVIAKVETLSALRNLDSIVEASDAVLVARGDLGIRLSLEEVPYYQKIIVEKCLEAGKPVIVATQFLASMVESTTPTRAEVVDVNLAVSQGVDAIMLTNETSVGKNPLEAVKWLKRIIDYTEEKMLANGLERAMAKARSAARDADSCFARGILELAESMGAKLVLYSARGRMAAKVAALRPSEAVFVGTPNRRVARKLALLWGLHPFKVEAEDYDAGLKEALERCVEKGWVREGDTVVLGYGLRPPEQKIVIKKIATA